MGVVSDKFQVVIPPSVRKAAKIKPGQRVHVSESGGVIHITPEKSGKPSVLETGKGMIKAELHVSVEEMNGATGREA